MVRGSGRRRARALGGCDSRARDRARRVPAAAPSGAPASASVSVSAMAACRRGAGRRTRRLAHIAQARRGRLGVCGPVDPHAPRPPLDIPVVHAHASRARGRPRPPAGPIAHPEAPVRGLPGEAVVPRRAAHAVDHADGLPAEPQPVGHPELPARLFDQLDAGDRRRAERHAVGGHAGSGIHDQCGVRRAGGRGGAHGGISGDGGRQAHPQRGQHGKPGREREPPDRVAHDLTRTPPASPAWRRRTRRA